MNVLLVYINSKSNCQVSEMLKKINFGHLTIIDNFKNIEQTICNNNITHLIIDLNNDIDFKLISRINKKYIYLSTIFLSLQDLDISSNLTKIKMVHYFVNNNSILNYSTKTLTSILKKNIIESNLNPFDKITPREDQALKLFLEGYKTKEVAQFLAIKQNTVSTVKKKIFKKLSVQNFVELMHLAIQHKYYTNIKYLIEAE
jgi:DNA-binding CsgD family transcriptional regulator